MLNFKISEEKCTKCGLCVKECPMSIIEMTDYPAIKIGKERNCVKCQHCLAICPTAALSIFGKKPENSISCNGDIPKAEEMMRLIKTRRSIRKYKKEDIDKDLLNEILNTALYAPTGHNKDSVLFTVIDKKESLDKFREIAYKTIIAHAENNTIAEEYKYIANLANLWATKAIDIMFRDAPHMIIASAPESISSPVEDSVIALSYFELLANSNGIGVLWSGMINWTLKFIAPELREILNIPKDHKIGYTLVFGKASTKYARAIQRENKGVNKISL